MTWTKTKTAVAAGVVVLLVMTVIMLLLMPKRNKVPPVTPAVAPIVKIDHFSDSLTPQEIVKQSQAAYAALTSYSDDGKTTGAVGNMKTIPITFVIRLARPNLFRVGWAEDYGSFVQTGMVWSAGSGNFMMMPGGYAPIKFAGMEGMGGSTGISGGASGDIPGTFFKLHWGNQLGSSMNSARRTSDEKVGDVDCYALSLDFSSGQTKTIWIGKQDFLIHQIEIDTPAATARAEQEEAAKKLHRPPAAVHSVSGDVKSVETHENIVVNQRFSPSDFAP